MAKIVAKFGGTSVADIERIEFAADKVAKEYKNGHSIAVVVSAMSGVTNSLVGYCDSVSSSYDSKEYDTVVSSGEQVTAGLMALALQKRGINARSWMGWQIPMLCDDVHGKARIKEINACNLSERMILGEVAVVAGFQGITEENRIATLGRGGSDTTAVAIASAVKADRCDIYTDVDGVYTADPRIVSKARRIKTISYEEMLELAYAGAKVLQTRSVEMAMKNGVSLQVLSSFDKAIGSELPGTIVIKEEDIMEKEIVNGITYKKDEAKITLIGIKDVPGVAARVFCPLAEANINVDMIVQNISRDHQKTDLTFTIVKEDVNKAIEVINNSDIEAETITTDDNVSKVSIVGIGMNSHAGVAKTMFEALAKRGINIHVISTSEIKISVLISAEYTELAVRALHEAYGL